MFGLVVTPAALGLCQPGTAQETQVGAHLASGWEGLAQSSGSLWVSALLLTHLQLSKDLEAGGVLKMTQPGKGWDKTGGSRSWLFLR